MYAKRFWKTNSKAKEYLKDRGVDADNTKMDLKQFTMVWTALNSHRLLSSD
jgi:hypothetical protein